MKIKSKFAFDSLLNKHFAMRLTIAMLLLHTFAISYANTNKDDFNKTYDIQSQITGTVTDADGIPLVGASIIEKGTTNGVQTDFEGNYNITTTSVDAVLVVSYIGYLNKEITVGANSIINVTLEEDVANLDEVVVVGFGTQKSSRVVSSVVQVTNEELQVDERPVTNVIAALQGSAPGLVIRNNNGSPGSTPSFQIRGASTLNDTDVLVIVDGFEGSLRDVDPQTIESVSVLKDASASAVYGARGANGVLLITTKNTGRDRKTSINYNFNTSIQSKPRLPQTLNSIDYLEFQNLADPGRWGEETLDLARSGFFPDTVWSDELYENIAIQQSHNLTLTGGSANTGYLLSASYLTQDGLAVGDDQFERLNLRLKIDTDINDWFTIGANALISNTTDNDIPIITGTNIRGLPLFPTVSSDGFFVSNGTTDAFGNVVAQASSGSFTETDTDRVNLQLYAQVKPFKGLVLEERVSIIKTNSLVRDWTNVFDIVEFNALEPDTYTNTNAPGNTNFIEASPDSRELNLLSFTSQEIRTLTSLTYNFEKEKHSAKVFLGFQTETGEDEQFITGRQNFLFDNIIALDQGQVINNNIGGSIGNTETRFGNATTLSYIGRLNYTFDNKYTLEAAFRRDGTSFFTENNKWGFFPSVALGWVISNEKFLENVSFVDQLKFRGSYGASGDDGPLGSVTQQLVNFNASGYPIGGEIASRINIPNFVNPNLIWETATILNVGIDASLFRGKFQFQADYFENNRTDIVSLINTTAFEFGFGDAQGNPFDVKSWGWELSATHKNKIGDFNYSISANISDYDNEITRLTEDAEAPNFQEGQSISDRFGYVTDGFFDSEEEIAANLADDGVTLIDQSSVNGRPTANVGDFKYVDQITVDTDGDGIPDARDGIINNDDLVVIEENSAANFNFGLNLNVGYKNLSLSARFYGVFYNKQWLNEPNSAQPFLGGSVPFTYQTDVWSPTNTNALFPVLRNVAPLQGYNTTVNHLLIDAEYLKLQNITLNYDFSNEVLDKLSFIKAMNLYVSAENIGVIWTNSELFDQGWDPELGVNAVDSPLAFTTSIGINIKF